MKARRIVASLHEALVNCAGVFAVASGVAAVKFTIMQTSDGLYGEWAAIVLGVTGALCVGRYPEQLQKLKSIFPRRGDKQ